MRNAAKKNFMKTKKKGKKFVDRNVNVVTLQRNLEFNSEVRHDSAESHSN